MMRKPPPNAYLNVLQDFLGITIFSCKKFIFCKKLFISNKNLNLKKKKNLCEEIARIH